MKTSFISFKPMSRLLLLVCAIFGFTCTMSAQLGLPPSNPLYNPALPDSIIDIGCGLPQVLDCPTVDLPFPALTQSFIMEIKVDSVPNTSLAHRFTLGSAVDVRITYQMSVEMIHGVSLHRFSQLPPNCLNVATGFLSTELSHTDCQGILDTTLTLPAGEYLLITGVFASICGYWDYDPWPYYDQYCGQAEIQLSLEILTPTPPAAPGDICQLAIPIVPTEVFNDSRVQDNLLGSPYAGNFGCAVNDIGQTERWFSFEAVKSTTFIQALRTGSGNFDGAIEVYQGCNNPPIACQNTVGNNEIMILPTNVGQTYQYRIYHSGAQALNNTAYSTALAYVPPTQLRPQDCGLMSLTPASIIRSDWPSNQFLLANWEFKFEEQEAPFATYEIISPNGSNPQFRMLWFPQMEPGRTYKVWTRPRMYQGPTWGDYAGSCVIGTATGWSLNALEAELAAPMQSLTSAGNIALNLWPNPAQQEFSISFQPGAGDAYADLMVYDMNGKLLDQRQVPISPDAGHITIVHQTDKLSTGLYLLQVRTQSGSATHKLSVSK